jgi:hypothetical protein
VFALAISVANPSKWCSMKKITMGELKTRVPIDILNGSKAHGHSRVAISS